MGLLSKTKDWLVQKAALHYLNTQWLGPYGRATSISIDSTAKTVRIELELKGESVPVSVDVVGYQIIKEGERYLASAAEIRTSREWLTQLVRSQMGNSPIEVPPELGRRLMLAL